MKKIIFILIFLISACGQDRTYPEPFQGYDGMDCGDTERSLYDDPSQVQFYPPYLITIDSRATEENLKAIRGAVDRWNNAVGEVVLSEAEGEASVHLWVDERHEEDQSDVGCTSGLSLYKQKLAGYVPCISHVAGTPYLSTLEGYWLHELGHVLGVAHPLGENNQHTNRHEIEEIIDECTARSIMWTIGGFITADAVRIIKKNFNI